MISRAFPYLMAALLPLPALGVTLELPGNAFQSSTRTTEFGRHAIPTAGWDGEKIPSIPAEGQITRQVWVLSSSGLTPLQILAPLRRQLEEAGYSEIFECASRQCGGFDFRYELALSPDPRFYVDLGNFQFLATERKSDAGSDFVTILTSRSASAGFAHITQVAVSEEEIEVAAPDEDTPLVRKPVVSTDLIERLLQDGHSPLDDLVFATGSSRLGDESFASLADIAGFLKENPDARITFVGHTDADGSLDANINLSRTRANAVRSRIIDAYQVSENQVSAEGVGFLAPRASNATEEGRSANRRVDAVLFLNR
jgi:OOP family OmpA-OmpF porin